MCPLLFRPTLTTACSLKPTAYSIQVMTHSPKTPSPVRCAYRDGASMCVINHGRKHC